MSWYMPLWHSAGLSVTTMIHATLKASELMNVLVRLSGVKKLLSTVEKK
jgi:hypothetical protein